MEKCICIYIYILTGRIGVCSDQRPGRFGEQDAGEREFAGSVQGE